MCASSRFSARTFTRDHTRQLRNLETAVEEARQVEEAAASAVDGVAQLALAASAELADAETRAAAMQDQCDAARAAHRSLQQAIEPISRAKQHAETVVAKINPLLAAAHEAAYVFLAAWRAIEELDACVTRRKAKNDSIPAIVLNEIEVVRNHADEALALLTTALDEAMTTAAISRRAAVSSAQALELARGLPQVLEPAASRSAGLDAEHSTNSQLHLLIDLAARVRRQDPGVIPVFSLRTTIAQRHLDEKRAAARQAGQALEDARFVLSRASASTLSATAALAAARAAVA